MSLFFAYLIKFSISLAAVYLFYRFVLRKLTFYSWNRWYLLGYTLISFFIAAINITPLLQQNQLADNKTIQWVPSLDLYSQHSQVNDAITKTSGQWSVWNWALFILIAGTIVLFTRLFIQYLSFLRIRSKAELLSDNGMRIYQVEGDIIPFSFGNSIFINQNLHTEDELKEIIRHEFVHVKQRHSVDILWGEFLCIINWYNPFAWFLRHAIRQNLEFIADNKVVSNGVDRKQYQYLLLKVIGNNHFSIASKFNFSSLKKRIAMMNKLRSAKGHLLKFLFILPVAVVMLLAFRNKDGARSADAKNILQDTIPVNKIKLPDEILSIGLLQKEGADPSDPINKKLGGKVAVKRKDGSIEIYDLGSDESLSKFNKKYGVKLEDILPPLPPPAPDAPIPTEMAEPQRTVNSKGYLIDIVGFDGTCTVLVKDKNGKELERVTLDKWKEDDKYEELYGEILPPSSPVVPVAPLSPLTSLPALSPMAPIAPVDCPVNTTTPVALVVGNGYGISSSISRDYEITDKKATLKLLDGTVENYDLTNAKEKAVFEKKYGKIYNLNTNVNGNVSGNVSINGVITTAAPSSVVFNGKLTPGVTAIMGNEVVRGSGPQTTVATPYPSGTVAMVDETSYIITGKEDIIITITSKTTQQELDKFVSDMKAKGITLSYDQIEYDEKGRLVVLSGTMKSGDNTSNFVATDFSTLILAMVKIGDKTWFKVSVKEKEVI